MRSMRTCVTDRQTDRQTEGAGYLEPEFEYEDKNNLEASLNWAQIWP